MNDNNNKINNGNNKNNKNNYNNDYNFYYYKIILMFYIIQYRDLNELTRSLYPVPPPCESNCLAISTLPNLK